MPFLLVFDAIGLQVSGETLEEFYNAGGIRNDNEILIFQNGQPPDHFSQFLSLDHRIVMNTRFFVTLNVAFGQFDAKAAHTDPVTSVVGYLTPLQTGHCFRIVNVGVNDAQSIVVVAHQLQPLQDVMVEVDPDGRLQLVSLQLVFKKFHHVPFLNQSHIR